jgi:hypothetical protein
MKIKHILVILAAFFTVFSNAACRRVTPHDVFLPDPNCKKLGYYSSNYTNYHYGYYIYSMDATLDTAATITSISADIKGSNTAIAAIYDNSLYLIAQSAQTSVSDGWNKIEIPATMLQPGTYRLAIATINDSSSGIRSESGKGMRYATSYSFGSAPLSIDSSSPGNYALLLYGNYCP